MNEYAPTPTPKAPALSSSQYSAIADALDLAYRAFEPHRDRLDADIQGPMLTLVRLRKKFYGLYEEAKRREAKK